MYAKIKEKQHMDINEFIYNIAEGRNGFLVGLITRRQSVRLRHPRPTLHRFPRRLMVGPRILVPLIEVRILAGKPSPAAQPDVPDRRRNAEIAQLAERCSRKAQAAGSNPALGSTLRRLAQLVAQVPYKHTVGGSSPSPPTTWARRSVGRSLAPQVRGRGFESHRVHQTSQELHISHQGRGVLFRTVELTSTLL